MKQAHLRDFRETIISETRRFGPAIVDQGVWSIAGFVASAMVGRFMGPEGLGWFALGVAILFGIGGLVNSLVLDPAAVLGPRDYRKRLEEYGGRLVLASGVFGVSCALPGLVLLLTGAVTATRITGAALMVTLPAFLAWTARRLPYITDRPSVALAGTFVYVAGVIGMIVALSALDRLTPVTAVLTLGLASAAQAAVGLWLWKPRLGAVRRTERRPWDGLVAKHWAFGRWLLAAEGASWVLNYGMAAISAGVIGISAAGGFRASQVLLRPYGIVFVGLTLAYVPRLARLLGEGRIDRAQTVVIQVGWGLSAIGAAVFLALLIAGGSIMALVFGEEFRTYGWLAAAISGAMMLHGWISALSMGLQARDRTKDVFLGQAASAVTTLLGSLVLGLWLGLAGFAITFWVATLARLWVVHRLYRRARWSTTTA